MSESDQAAGAETEPAGGETAAESNAESTTDVDDRHDPAEDDLFMEQVRESYDPPEDADGSRDGIYVPDDGDGSDGETTIPETVDWTVVWEDAGCPPREPMSGTQLALAVDVSDATGRAGRGAAETLLSRAVESGNLEPEYVRDGDGNPVSSPMKYRLSGGDSR